MKGFRGFQVEGGTRVRDPLGLLKWINVVRF
jgi:hypothetical protein